MKKWLLLLLSVLYLTGCGEKADTAWESSSPKSISGKITILPELKEKVETGDVIFVMAKGKGGPPIAVKRLVVDSLPMSYTLSEENDLMLPGSVFPEKINITARVDKDGNASPAQPGDLGGEYAQNPAPVGSSQIDIEINRLY